VNMVMNLQVSEILGNLLASEVTTSFSRRTAPYSYLLIYLFIHLFSVIGLFVFPQLSR
jgi:hypothetical protein